MTAPSGATTLPDRRLARQIIETIGQMGTPPPHGVSFYNVGNENLLKTIEDHYLTSYLPDGGAVFKLVVGDYGAGKSHFLYCLRDLAWKHGFAVSKVDLSPRESPYDDQKKVYAAVAANLIWHTERSLNDDQRGISNFLTETLRALLAQHQVPLGDQQAAELAEVKAARLTLQMTPIDSMSYRKAILAFWDATLYERGEWIEALTRWLHGEECSPIESKLLKSLGVTDKITKNNAFKMLRSLCQTIRALSYTGLVLLFDEGDRMLSITKRAEKAATDNLREVIDRCRDELPGAMFVYAVPHAFINDVVTRYQALDQRVKSPTKFSRTNPFSPQVDLDRLDLQEGVLLQQIGMRLLAIFEIAYDHVMDSEIQAQNIQALATAAADSFLATNPRRLFVKTLIAELYLQKETGEVLIDAQRANDLIHQTDQKDLILTEDEIDAADFDGDFSND
jgi:hypothetical protein